MEGTGLRTGEPSGRQLNAADDWRAIALAGNAVVLAIVGVLLCAQATLFDPPAWRDRSTRTEGARTSAGEGATVRPLLLIVVDALRDDTSRSAALMPALAALAERGQRETAEIDLPLPSTIGAIETIVEGVPPPPSAALGDFGAAPAAAGGWLERLVGRGGSAFVAGPDLWTERYGRWFAGSWTEAGMPTSRSDERVAAAARQALTGSSPTLVIAHLAETDAVAHRHGAGSREWWAAVRRADAHIEALVEAAGERAVIVLADHGTTLRGGHAGGERVVRRVPLVAAGFAVPPPGDAATSARPCELVSAALFHGAGCLGVDERRARDVARPYAIVVVLALLLGAVGTLRAVAVLSRRAVPGFVVSAAVWAALAASVPGRADVGAAIAVLSLGACGAFGTARHRLLAPAATAPGAVVHGTATLVGTVACGALLALMARTWAGWTADAAAGLALPWLLVAAGAALGGGFAASRVARPEAAAVTLAAVIALAVHLGGETLSLSSVDVRLAHRAAGLVSGPGGIVLAVPVALARLLLPIAFALLGYRLGRRARSRVSTAVPAHGVAFAQAFALCQTGAVAVYAFMLVSNGSFGEGSLPPAAAGLGGLLRELLTSCAVAGTLAVLAYRAGASRAEPAAA